MEYWFMRNYPAPSNQHPATSNNEHNSHRQLQHRPDHQGSADPKARRDYHRGRIQHGGRGQGSQPGGGCCESRRKGGIHRLYRG